MAFDVRYEEAAEKVGLEMNPFAQFYLYFRSACLPAKFVDDIKMRIHGDFRRYQEARTFALGMSQEGYYQDSEVFHSVPSFPQHSWTGYRWTEES